MSCMCAICETSASNVSFKKMCSRIYCTQCYQLVRELSATLNRFIYLVWKNQIALKGLKEGEKTQDIVLVNISMYLGLSESLKSFHAFDLAHNLAKQYSTNAPIYLLYYFNAWLTQLLDQLDESTKSKLWDKLFPISSQRKNNIPKLREKAQILLDEFEIDTLLEMLYNIAESQYFTEKEPMLFDNFVQIIKI
jgi:hypothetical protein